MLTCLSPLEQLPSITSFLEGREKIRWCSSKGGQTMCACSTARSFEGSSSRRISPNYPQSWTVISSCGSCARFARLDCIETFKSEGRTRNIQLVESSCFSEGTVYSAKLKIALFFETYIMPAFPEQ